MKNLNINLESTFWQKPSFRWRIAAVVLFLSLPQHRIYSEESPSRPNIILMMCDDLGWGDLQCYNPQSPILTPHLNLMAKNGLKFNRFYAAAPVCSPTRGSCLTGRHPFRYGIYFANTGHLPQEEITLPEILKQHGYRTGHFGKWHLGTLTTKIKDANRGGPTKTGRMHFSPPQQHGYDACFVTESKVPTYDPMLKPKKANKKVWDFLKDRSQGFPYGTFYWNEKGKIVSDNLEGDDSRVIMDRVIPFMNAAVKNKEPFFAVIWFHAPHLPVVAGAKHVAPYAEHSQYERNYYGSVTAIDEQVGRLRKQLRSWNVANSTMFWFCSDNGPEGKEKSAPGSASLLKGRKRSLYEGGIRVPGLLEWPSHIDSRRTTDFPAVTSDYLPTILDALQIDYPSGRPLDGVSLMPVIEGKLQKRTKPIGFQSAKQQVWMNQQYKLYSADAGDHWELYDLLEDPAETKNLSHDFSDTVDSLSQSLELWIKSCKNSDLGMDYPSIRNNQ